MTARDADIDALRKGALRGVLVVADEGHHCADANASGRTLATLRSKGAATLLVSATPWATAGNVGGDDCKAHRLSEVDYVSSFGPDDAHHPPGRFITGRVLVGKPVRDADDTIDRSGSVRKSSAPEGDDAKARRFCAAMAKRWADDGFPRAVFNVPLQAWAAPLAKALRKIKPDADLLDLVGDMSTAELDAARARLAYDSAATSWRDVQISAVMSCARMDEGTDWVPCSHVYNVGIPAVPGLILQRWGRAARAKGKIAGYPKRWADARTLVFFTPPGTGEGDTWKAQTEVAWLLGGFLADYRAALEWTQERKARGIKGPLPVPASSPVVAAWQGKLAEQVQRVGGEMSADDARAWLARQKKAPPAEVIDTVVRRMQMQDPKHRAEEDERQASGLRVRAARRPEAAPLIEEVFKTPLRSTPAFEAMVEFTAREGKEIAARMRFTVPSAVSELVAFTKANAEDFFRIHGKHPSHTSGPCGSTTWSAVQHALMRHGLTIPHALGNGRWPSDIESMLALAREHGQAYMDMHGEWPTVNSGAITTLGGGRKKWNVLNAILSKRGSSLRQAFGLSGCKTIDDWCDEIAEYFKTDGTPKAGTSLYSAWVRIRASDPGKLLARGLPIKADRSAALRQRWATGRARTASGWAEPMPRGCGIRPEAGRRCAA